MIFLPLFCDTVCMTVTGWLECFVVKLSLKSVSMFVDVMCSCRQQLPTMEATTVPIWLPSYEQLTLMGKRDMDLVSEI